MCNTPSSLAVEPSAVVAAGYLQLRVSYWSAVAAAAAAVVMMFVNL